MAILRALLTLIFFTLLGGAAQAQDLHFFRIATGSAAGTYFPIGMGIATAISSPPGSRGCKDGGSCGVPGLVAVARTSDGSVANVEAVAKGNVDAGLAQADIIAGAFNGEGLYFRRGRLANLRVIANLYPENVHLVVRKGSGIRQVSDLIGKRVSIDRPGSGTRLNVEAILGAYNIRLGQLRTVEVDPGDAVNLFTADALDAFFLIAGYPASAVFDVTELGLADLVPIGGGTADAALQRYRFFSRDIIPAGTYKGIPAVATLSIGTQLVVSDSADADLIYEITKALWTPRNRPLLEQSHAKAKLIRQETALVGVATPLHPGAERYYREIGLLKDRPVQTGAN